MADSRVAVAQPAFAAFSAVVQAARGDDDSVTLLDRMCESVTVSLGFDRAVIARYFAERDRVEIVAAHGLKLQEVSGLIASGDDWAPLREARDTGSPVLVDEPPANAKLTHDVVTAYGLGAAVVVPLVSGRRCLGFLAADCGGEEFDLDETDVRALATLGTIVAELLRRALAHDDLVDIGRLKSDFIAFASHELRRPAAVICGIAETLHTHEGSLTEPHRSGLLTALHEQGEQLHSLVDQLLDLSRLEARSIRIAPTSLAVRERVEAIVRGVGAESSDAIEIRIAPTLRATADPDAVDRIVANLVANALRYGQLPISVAAAVHDRHFRLTVEDRGRGVPPEFVPRLFDRFARADHSAAPGAGLGLSIAQAYARAHGGQLLYESATPHGARFQLVLPDVPS